jgi:subtilisin family serine protease
LDAGIDPRSSRSFRGRVKGRNFIKGENTKDFWSDETGHGTAVAYQIARVCPNAEIYIARIAKRTDPDGKIVPDREAIVQALKVASEEWEVDIINMSFGWEVLQDDDGIEEALDAVALKRVLIFASSTNTGALNDILFPARHRDVIAVDAVDGLGKPFSNTGSTKSGRKRERFSAPGLNVASPGDKRVTGSSFASPVVAGIAGLVIETFRQEMPDLDRSVYKRLRTKEGMELVLKLLSKEVEGFNFLEPWIKLDVDSRRSYICENIIRDALRPVWLTCGASYCARRVE